MPAPEIVRQLVQRFADHQDAYHSPAYNEAQLRQEFLNPFFEALGWDVANKKDYAVQYREVIHEDSIHIKGSPNAKAPDYAFRLGGVRKFFVEAKKPAEDIENTKDFAYQLKIYAWNTSLPLSILTDFEEFAVYDCRSKPNRSDSPATGCVMYIRYDEYLDRWDEIAGIFSPDAIRKGAFDKYAEDNTAKKGTTSVDEAFLQEIEQWRALLARNIALRNPQVINERQLNFAVQMTIDRIIFLRICEDRGIEPQNQLLEMGSGKEIYPELVQLFQRADLRYNSGLFHFKEEKGNQNHVDTFTTSLTIDDKVLKTIIKSLYYPCPYVFKEIPVEILGQVYEQFLGKVIRLTPGHQAKIEEKPEVRKAGGVYYTPKYIVDYIVGNTVGKLLEGKTPEDAAGLKIVDPACGSGSFLLGAFQYLMDWHEDYYLAHDPEKWAKGAAPAIVQTADGDWRLTTDEKKRILVNNIHGVDIDSQAVEVTKLSLLLKVLEEETGQLTLGFERALPDLSDNIKCGNSLIGWDYFEGQLLPSEEEVARVNPFDWEQAFPGVLAKGGFDAVIGNPPYLNIDDTWGRNDPKRIAIKQIYPSIYRDKTDILFYFIGNSIKLTKGYVCFIVSRAFLEAYKADKLRAFILDNSLIQEIIDFQNGIIFKGIGISTCIVNFHVSNFVNKFVVYKLIKENVNLKNLRSLIKEENVFKKITIEQNNLSSDTWAFSSKEMHEINDKVDLLGTDLGNLCVISQGMQTGRNKIFEGITFNEITEWGLKIGQYFKRARNSDIYRYKIIDKEKYILYPQVFKKFSELPDGLQTYLKLHSKELKDRAAYQRGDCEWWKYTWPLREEYYDSKRILCPFYSQTNRFAIDEDNKFLSLTDTTVIFDSNQNEDILYLLGLLNSKLLTYRYKRIGKLKGGGIYEYIWNSLSKIPIRTINFKDNDDLKKHNQVVILVGQMLELHKRTSQTPLRAGAAPARNRRHRRSNRPPGV